MKEVCRNYLMKEFGGDEAVVADIYGEYAASAAGKLAEIKAAIASGSWAAVDSAAHALKGNALAAGDLEMADVAIALRKAAALSDAESAMSLADRLSGLNSGL